jgi:hypothetical protein
MNDDDTSPLTQSDTAVRIRMRSETGWNRLLNSCCFVVPFCIRDPFNSSSHCQFHLVSIQLESKLSLGDVLLPPEGSERSVKTDGPVVTHWFANAFRSRAEKGYLWREYRRYRLHLREYSLTFQHTVQHR